MRHKGNFVIVTIKGRSTKGGSSTYMEIKGPKMGKKCLNMFVDEKGPQKNNADPSRLMKNETRW